MDRNILVAYASRYGATREIAEKIGQVLRYAGLQADVLPVAGFQDLNRYNAVILGSALYMGNWRKEAVDFLKAYEKTLSERPVWLFSSGPTGEGDPLKLLKGKILPEAVQSLADHIHPRGMTAFQGCINPDKISFIEKLVIKGINKPTGDFRNWNGINAWASSVAVSLKEA